MLRWVGALIIFVGAALAAAAVWGGSLDWAGPRAAEGVNGTFWHVRETRAPAARVWALWMDVDGWKEWDLGLSNARTSGRLTLGAQGVIVAKGGQESNFIVTEYTEGVSYAYRVDLPGAQLTVRRRILGAAPVTIRHDVRFDGPLAGIWA